jgi:hypothetical protein
MRTSSKVGMAAGAVVFIAVCIIDAIRRRL